VDVAPSPTSSQDTREGCPYEPDDAVNMVWHDDELVQLDACEALRQSQPFVLDYSLELIVFKQRLFLVRTDCYEVGSSARVVIAG
jgi:hypothetical protein